MSAASALRSGRRMAESLMVDTVKVTRATPGGAMDPVTGEAASETVYTGKAKLQNQSQYESEATSGQHVTTSQRSLVHFPVGSFAQRDGDLCEFTASTVPFLVGQKYRLAGEAPLKTFETAYRVYADQVIS